MLNWLSALILDYTRWRFRTRPQVFIAVFSSDDIDGLSCCVGSDTSV